MHRHGLISGRVRADIHPTERRLAHLRLWRIGAHVFDREPLRGVQGRSCVAPPQAPPWKELTFPMDLNDLEIGPADVELAAIELEWPLIAAELDIVDAEIRLLTSSAPTYTDWRRLRRAERRRLRALAELLDLSAAVLVRPAGSNKELIAR